MTRPLVPLYAASMGANPFLIGVVVAAHSLISLVLAVPAGSLTDFFGPKRMIIAGGFGMAASAALIGLIPGYASLIMGESLLGLSSLCIIVASQTFAGSVGPPSQRESNFGWFTTFASAGQLAGPLLGGLIADFWSFQLAFLAGGVFGLVASATAVLLPATKVRPQAQPLSGETWRIRRLMRNDGVKAAIVSSFGVLFAIGVRGAFFPLYMAGLGYTATAISVQLMARALASMVVRPFLPHIVRLSGGRFVVLVGSIAVAAVGLGITPFFASFWPLFFCSLLIGVGLGLCQPLSMVAVADNTSDEERGLAMGLRLTGNRLAQVTNPLIFGLIATLSGLLPAFIVSGVILLGTAGLLGRWRSVFTPRPEEPKMPQSA